MAGFDVVAAMEALAQLARTIPDIEAVQVGAPKSLTGRVETWITVSEPDEVKDVLTGVVELGLNLVVWFGYDVQDAEETAETQLAEWLTELTKRLVQNRRQAVTGNSVTVAPLLGGTVYSMSLPRAAAGVSEYALMAGLETRLYPIGVTIRQRSN